MTKRPIPVARLAFREEGKWWRCYLAPLSGMDKAMEIAAIRINLVKESPETKAAFMKAMEAAFTSTCEAVGLGTPTFPDPKPAPESERGGNA